jgi:hypothetical protein
MHDKYGKDGLVVYSVLLDDPKDAAIRATGDRYLGNVKVSFPIVYLDMPPADWSKKLRLDAYPGVFIFNRANKYVEKLPRTKANGDQEDFEYADIEKTVQSLLKE